MTIQGTSTIASMYNNSYFSSTNLSTQSSEEQESMNGVQGTPPAGPPPGPPPELNLDTDEDDMWSESEISDFAEEMGLSIDASEIISTYDTDGDGKISVEEREAMAQDNALQLTQPPEGMMQMNIQTSTEEETDTTAQDTSELFTKMMEAYMGNSSEQEEVVSLLDIAL